MTVTDTTGWIACDVCTYPHAPNTGCPNPACLANPTLSDATRESIAQRIANHIRETEDRAMLARARAQSFAPRR